MIQPMYMLFFESMAIDCPHLMGFLTTSSGSMSML